MFSPLETTRAYSWQRIPKPEFAYWQQLWLFEAQDKRVETWNKLGTGQPMAGVKQRDRQKELPSPGLLETHPALCPKDTAGPSSSCCLSSVLLCCQRQQKAGGPETEGKQKLRTPGGRQSSPIQMLLISWASGPHTAASLTVINNQEALLKLPGCRGIRGLVQTSAVQKFTIKGNNDMAECIGNRQRQQANHQNNKQIYRLVHSF